MSLLALLGEAKMNRPQKGTLRSKKLGLWRVATFMIQNSLREFCAQHEHKVSCGLFTYALFIALSSHDM